MDLQKLLSPGLGAEALAGLNPMLRDALQNMVMSAPTDVRSSLRINSGHRTVDRQRELYEAALKKYGSESAARKWVAPPGRSQHNFGKAVDLGYLSPRAKAWVHENASQFGLHFPMAHEPWHVEMVGGRDSGGVEVAANVAANNAPNNGFGASPVDPIVAPVNNAGYGLGAERLLGGGSTKGPAIIRGQLDPTIYQNI